MEDSGESKEGGPGKSRTQKVQRGKKIPGKQEDGGGLDGNWRKGVQIKTVNGEKTFRPENPAKRGENMGKEEGPS